MPPGLPLRRLALLLPLALLSAPAAADDRTLSVPTFDRVRIEGAFDVRLATGTAPRAKVSGDPRALDLVDLRVDGTTLTLRRRRDTDAGVRAAAVPVTVTLATPALRSASIIGGATLAIAGLRADRADLSVAGTGTIAATGIAAEQANAQVIGDGRVTLAGRAAHVRLLSNGPGAIDASALAADELIVLVDGPGETRAQARYVASVTTTGLGRVTVAGNAKCTVRAPAGGAVLCGAK